MKHTLPLSTIFVVLAILVTPKTIAQSQEPKFFITWQAQSYTPQEYSGKILPTASSPVLVSFELYNPARGTFLDLSGQTIYWYVNGDFVQGGMGLQGLSFFAPTTAGGTVDVRIQFPNYQGNVLVKTVHIPIAPPEVVLEAPFPNNRFPGSLIHVKAQPYFWSVPPSALTFSWSVNGAAPKNAESPQVLTISLNPDAPSGSTLSVSVNVQNPKTPLESVTQAVNLTFTR